MTCQLYRHYDASHTLLYVGISLSALHRLAQHKEHAHWFDSIDHVTIERFASREVAIEAEKEAIRVENPLHNLHRYSEKIPTRVSVEKSRAELLNRIVAFNPTYSLSEVGQTLGMSMARVKTLVSSGKLSSYVDGRGTNKHGHPYTKYRVTGWQLIEYLEALQEKPIEVAT